MIGIDRPRPYADVLVFALDEDLLIYPGDGRGRREAVIKLDAFGRAVWELCDGERTIYEISLALQEKLPDQSRSRRLFRDVEKTIAQFVDEGLLDVVAADGVSLTDAGDASLWAVFDDRQVRVDLPSGDEELSEGFRARLGRLLDDGSSDRTTVDAWSLQREDERFVLRRGDEIARVDDSLVGAVRFLEGEIVRAFMKSDDRIWLHAGAVVRDGRAVLFCGAAGRGKSTLTTGLVARGWRYLSDETVPMQNLRAWPFPRSPVVRDPGTDASQDAFHALRRVEVEITEEQICREDVAIGALVFPRYAPDESTRLLPQSTADAALELLENCSSFSGRGEESVRGVVESVRAVPCFDLPYASGEEAVDLVDRAAENWFLEA